MVRKRNPDNLFTTIRVSWITKAELLAHQVGRETEDEILQRVLKKFHVKVVKKENQAAYIPKLNQPRRKTTSRTIRRG